MSAFDTTADRIHNIVKEGNAEYILASLRSALSESGLMTYVQGDPLYDHLIAATELVKERYLVRNLPAGSQPPKEQESD